MVDEAPKDLQPYGLDKPRIEVAFKTAGDKDYRRLLVGSKTPTGGDLYAQRGGEKRVFVIPSYVESSFDRKPFDLRDKKILAFDREKVDRLEIAHGDVKLELTKSGQDWNMTAPVQAPADFGAVETIVTRLQSAQMKSLPAEQAAAADLKNYGLDKPVATATVGLGSTRATLAFGKAADEGGDVYAKDVTRPAVVTVAADLLTDVQKNVSDLRRKDIFEFRSFNAKRIEVARGAETLVFEKVKGTGKDATEKWRRVSPNPGDVDQAKIETFLSNLSGLRAQSFADAKTPTGLATPVATVTAKFDETNKEERVRFGRVGTDVFAGRGEEPGAARVETSAFDEADEVARCPEVTECPPALQCRLHTRNGDGRLQTSRAAHGRCGAGIQSRRTRPWTAACLAAVLVLYRPPALPACAILSLSLLSSTRASGTSAPCRRIWPASSPPRRWSTGSSPFTSRRSIGTTCCSGTTPTGW